MKGTEQYFPVVLFIILYKVVLTFESVGEIPKCGHSNERYWAILSFGTVYYAVQGLSPPQRAHSSVGRNKERGIKASGSWGEGKQKWRGGHCPPRAPDF